MFEKLFGKVSDVVYHTIGPYAAERRQFLEHCRQQGYRQHYLKQIAGVLLSAAHCSTATRTAAGQSDRIATALTRAPTFTLFGSVLSRKWGIAVSAPSSLMKA